MSAQPGSNSKPGAIAQLRQQLELVLTEHLDPSLGSHPPKKGKVPYSEADWKGKLLEIQVLMKICNCLYYAEMASVNLEKGGHKVVLALHHANELDNSLAQLDNVMPQIQAILSDDYNLFKPILDQAFEVLKKSKTIQDHIDSSGLDRTRTVMNQVNKLVESVNDTNPIEAAFVNLGSIMDVLVKAQGMDLSAEQTSQIMEQFSTLLFNLNNNPFFKQLSYSSAKDSPGFREFMDWVESVGAEGVRFTPNSLKKYAQWAQEYVPKLIDLADELEAKNFLQRGYLSSKIIEKVDPLIEAVNFQLQAPPLNIKEVIPKTDTLEERRANKTNARARENLTKITAMQEQLKSIKKFYNLIEKYKNHSSLDKLTEHDRQLLAELYPDVQMTLAYTDLKMENELALVLSKAGPSGPRPSPDVFAVTSRINDLLKTRDKVESAIEQNLESEHKKYKIANSVLTEAISKNDTIKISLAPIEKKPEKPFSREAIKPIQLKDLQNIEGIVTFLQELKLSKDVTKVKDSVIKLIPTNKLLHNTQEVKNLFILRDSLELLESLLKDFETQGTKFSIFNKVEFGGKLGKIMDKISELAPANQLDPIKKEIASIQGTLKQFAPIVVQTDKDIIIERTYPETYQKSIDLIKNAREEFIARCNESLSKPLLDLVFAKPQTMPLMLKDTDPPQVETYKKLINTLYKAEQTLQVWQNKRMKHETALDDLIYYHQLMVAAASFYQTIEQFDSAPEIQKMVADNLDIFGPVYSVAKAFVTKTDIKQETMEKQTALKLGEGINALQIKSQTNTSPVIHVLQELPTLINAQLKANTDNLKLTDKQIEALNPVIEALLNDKLSGLSVAESYRAYQSYKSIKNISDKSQKNAIDAYRAWIKEYYPILLKTVDRLEIKNNFKQGFLSEALMKQVDEVSTNLNTKISTKQDYIPLAHNFINDRIAAIEQARKVVFTAKHEVALQQKNVFDFLELLEDKERTDVTDDEKVKLKDNFISIQKVMSEVNLDLSNQLVDYFNSVPPKDGADKSWNKEIKLAV
ncbi:MAG: hypothetical protein WC627_11450, partial [Legionella sp.]